MKIRSDFVSNSSSSSFMVMLDDSNSKKFIDTIIPHFKFMSNFSNFPDIIIINNKCKLIEDLQKLTADSEMCWQTCLDHGLHIDETANTFIDLFPFCKFYDALNDAQKAEVRSNIVRIYKEDCVYQADDVDEKTFSEGLRKYLDEQHIEYTTSSTFV